MAAEVLHGCARQKLVPLRPPLLVVNGTPRRQQGLSMLHLSVSPSLPPSLPYSHASLVLLPSLLIHLPICSLAPYRSSSVLMPPCLCLSTVLHISILQSLLPCSSPLLARWLVYHWDGCRIKDATRFVFFFPPPLLLSLSLSLV